jgi:uncharacterized protein YlxW (UPF0749 family)
MGLFLTPQGSSTTRPAMAQQRAESASSPESSPENRTDSPGDRRVWWASLFVLCAVLGALLGLSFKTQDTITRLDLPSQNFGGLAERYRMLQQKDDGLERTVTDQTQRLERYQKVAATHSQTASILGEDLSHARFLAGLTPVAGPGLIVTLNDSKKTFPIAPAGIQNGGQTDSNLGDELVMIHDVDILQVINELRAAGAEAIAINDQRVVATSPIRCAGPTVLVNFVPVTPPFVIRAVGDPKTLEDAMNLKGGEAEYLRVRGPDMVKLDTANALHIPAYTGPSQPKYAKPDRQAVASADNGQASSAAADAAPQPADSNKTASDDTTKE